MEKNAQPIYLSLLDMHVAEAYAFSMQPEYNFYITRPGAKKKTCMRMSWDVACF